MIGSVRKAKDEVLAALQVLEQYVNDEQIPIQDRANRLDRLKMYAEQVRDGEYLVVILGEFNVGKTTLINAILGGEFLPGKATECTRLLTEIRHSDVKHISIALKKEPERTFLQQLKKIFKADADVSDVFHENGFNRIKLTPKSMNPVNFRKISETFLDARWSANTDDEEIRGFRRMLDETLEKVTLALPMPGWAEDILLVDSPGVNSISDTHTDITYSILPKCHLVLMLVNAESTGNAADRNFIELIDEYQQRKIFFIMNKTDHIPESEIQDAREALIKSLPKTISKPEIFALSSLFRLRARQLEIGSKSCQDIEAESTVRGALFDLQNVPDGEKSDAYRRRLEEQSHFSHLNERIDSYLRHENKEGALLEKGWSFIRDESVSLIQVMEREISVACDPRVLEEIRAKKEETEKKIKELDGKTDRALKRFMERTISNGTLEGIIKKHFGKDAKEELVRKVEEWLEDNNYRNLEKVKKDSKKLSHYLNEIIQETFGRGQSDLRKKIELAESELKSELQNIIGEMDDVLRFSHDEKIKNEFDVGGFSAYVFYTSISMAGAAALGATIGAWATAWTGPGALLGGAIGAGVGALVGTTVGYFTSDRERVKKLTDQISNTLDVYIVNGGSVDEVDPKTKKTTKKEVISIQAQMNETSRRIVEQIAKCYSDELRLQFKTFNKERDRFVNNGEEIQANADKTRSALLPKISELNKIHEQAKNALKTIEGAQYHGA